LRRLPVALGLQIILWNDIKEGRSMKWACEMQGRDSVSVDIASQMRKSLSQAKHEDHGHD
jgi:hypothetical protein